MKELRVTDTPAPAIGAYELLSKPTLELTDAEVDIIIADLRRRRTQFLSTGKPDKPKAEAKAKAEPLSKEAKAANTAALLAPLTMPKLDI
jgi:hypothetical protein